MIYFWHYLVSQTKLHFCVFSQTVLTCKLCNDKAFKRHSALLFLYQTELCHACSNLSCHYELWEGEEQRNGTALWREGMKERVGGGEQRIKRRVGGKWRETVRSQTGEEEEKPLSDMANVKRREREKSRRRSDSDHQRAERLTFFCLSIRGLISLWLGSRVPETGSIKVELRGIIRGSGTILLPSLPIQILVVQRHYTT